MFPFFFGYDVLEISYTCLPVYDSSPAQIFIRRSTNVSKPSYLKKFYCNLLSNNELPSCIRSYPLSKYLSYSSLFDSTRTFVLIVSSQLETSFLSSSCKVSTVKGCKQGVQNCKSIKE